MRYNNNNNSFMAYKGYCFVIVFHFKQIIAYFLIIMHRNCDNVVLQQNNPQNFSAKVVLVYDYIRYFNCRGNASLHWNSATPHKKKCRRG